MTKSTDFNLGDIGEVLSDRRAQQRELLLAAAYEMVPAVGIDGLRTRDITQAAGLNLAVFHYCFANKDALLTALYERILARFRAERERFFTADQTPEDRLRAHFELRVYVSQNMARDLKIWRAFQGVAATNSTVQRILKEHFIQQRATIADLLRNCAERGMIAAALESDFEIAASMLVSLQDGMMMQLTIDPDAFDADRYAGVVVRWISDSTSRNARIAD